MILEAITHLTNIVIPIWVCPLYANLDTYKTECYKTIGQVDTGATTTSISSVCKAKLEKILDYEYEPTGTIYISGVNSKPQELPLYRFNFVLEHEGETYMIRNIGAPVADIGEYTTLEGKNKNLDILIGMDIITKGDSLIDVRSNNIKYQWNSNKEASYTFYVSQHSKQNKKLKIINKKKNKKIR